MAERQSKPEQTARHHAPPAAARYAEYRTFLENGQTLGQAVKAAFKDRSYILLHLGFFTCGFHIAFLVTHLPNEIALCGLPASVASTSIAIIGLANIAGCIFSGWCTGRFLGKYVLFGLYASRVATIRRHFAGQNRRQCCQVSDRTPD